LRLSERLGIKHYLAGALLANGIRILLTTFSYAYLFGLPYPYLILGIWVISIFSCASAGFLLTRNMSGKHMLSGGVLGFYSYILYALLSFFGFTIEVEDLWILLGYVMGGLLGGRLGERGRFGIDVRRLLKFW